MSGSLKYGRGEARTSVPFEMNWVSVRPDLGLAARMSEELSVESVEAEGGLSVACEENFTSSTACAKRWRTLRTMRLTICTTVLLLHLVESHAFNSFYERNSHKLSQLRQKSTVTSNQHGNTQIVIGDNHND